MYRLKEFSYLTNGPVKVIVPWIDDENSSLYSQHKMLNYGMIIAADTVYSLFTGTVVHVGEDTSGHCVTIQYDADTCIRYCKLSSICVSEGQPVVYGDKIGQAQKAFKTLFDGNSFKFEYCNREEASCPVRFSRQTYFKHNPESLILNESDYQFDPELQMRVTSNAFYNPSLQILNTEFRSNGRG